MLNIVHITSSLARGGAEQVLCSLIQHLNQHQYKSHVIYFHGGPHAEHLQALGVPTYHIRGALFRYDPVFWWRLLRTIYKLKPDCIHALLWAAQIASRIIGYILHIPVVSAYHNQATLEHGLRAALDRATLPYATTIVAVSNTVAHSVQRQNKWLPAQRIVTIANGIDPEDIEQEAARQDITRKSLGIPAGAHIIGTVGRLHTVKNHALLLEAHALVCSYMPDTYLIIVGYGPEEENLKAIAARFGTADLTLFVTNRQAYGYYPLFDCFVLPSAQEGMSMALLEAQSFGCACIITHEQGPHDILTHEINGLIVPPHNPYLLASAITRILHNPILKDKLGSTAKKFVREQFSVVQMVKKYENVFKSTANKLQ